MYVCLCRMGIQITYKCNLMTTLAIVTMEYIHFVRFNLSNAEVNPLHTATYSVTSSSLFHYVIELKIVKHYCIACSFSNECQFKPVTTWNISCEYIFKVTSFSGIRIISEDLISMIEDCCLLYFVFTIACWLVDSKFIPHYIVINVLLYDQTFIYLFIIIDKLKMACE